MVFAGQQQSQNSSPNQKPQNHNAFPLLRHLVDVVADLHTRGIGLRSLQENIDTATASGKLFLHVFGALAEFERELVRDRTIAGLKAAADRGRKGGRPRLMDAGKVQLAQAMHKDKGIAVSEICRTLGVSKGTFYRNLGNNRVEAGFPTSSVSDVRG